MRSLQWRKCRLCVLAPQCKSLQQFMEILPLISEMGWEKAFEKNFGMSVEEFYIKSYEFTTNAKVSKEML